MYKNWKLLAFFFLFNGVRATKDGSIAFIISLMSNIIFFYVNHNIQNPDK